MSATKPEVEIASERKDMATRFLELARIQSILRRSILITLIDMLTSSCLVAFVTLVYYFRDGANVVGLAYV